MEQTGCRDGGAPLAGLSGAAVLRALPFDVCVTDTDFRIVYADGPWLADGPANGSAHLVGVPLLDRLSEPDCSRFEGVARNVLAMAEMGGADAWQDLEMRLGGGEEPPRRVLVCAVRDDAGQVSGVLATTGEPFRDAADAGREAARLDVARQLAATLNHEINNPLFVISATLEDMLAEATDPSAERRLHAALDAVWRVSSAVKQLSEIRQLISTAYIGGRPMIDLQASQEAPRPEQ